MSDPARILQEALTLDPADRARVARELIDSLEESEPDAAVRWAEEVRRRIDEIESGVADLEDWADVQERLRNASRP